MPLGALREWPKAVRHAIIRPDRACVAQTIHQLEANEQVLLQPAAPEAIASDSCWLAFWECGLTTVICVLQASRPKSSCNGPRRLQGLQGWQGWCARYVILQTQKGTELTSHLQVDEDGGEPGTLFDYGVVVCAILLSDTIVQNLHVLLHTPGGRMASTPL